jgi:hypothetical protein
VSTGVSAALSPDGDPQALLDALATGAERALPVSVRASALTVDRRRSMADRLAGRPGTVTSLTLTGGGETLTLALGPGPRWVPQVSRVSGGVVISRRTPPLGEWLGAFAGRIAALAADAAGDAASASTALQALGVQRAGADLHVDDADVTGGLRMLASRVRGRIPDDAADAVTRIVDLLLDTLPRVEGAVGADVVVRRTATAYLPDTVRAYLSLPADWATGHVFPDGTTPAGALVAQLAVIEKAAREMRDAAVENDANAMVVNGIFLADRFPTSTLEA